MFKKLTQIFSPASSGSQQQQNEHSLEFAIAVLLIEVMHADHIPEQQEVELINRLLCEYFNLDANQADELFSRAESRVNQVVSLQEFTRFLNQSLDYGEKVRLIENMWHVVFADGQVDKYEEHLVRKVADLIYVKHQDFIRARHRAGES